MYTRQFVCFLLLCLGASTSGCAVVSFLPMFISGAGAGASYSILNTAYKTETQPLKDVYRASIQSLRTMGFRIEKIQRKARKRRIKAASEERTVSMELKVVTDSATKIIVNVKEGSIFKDKATADEIIRQTEEVLEYFAQKRTRKGILTVIAQPEDALVRVMNIEPKFYQGMELSPGKYLIEISAAQYKTSKTWVVINPNENKFFEVALERLQ